MLSAVLFLGGGNSEAQAAGPIQRVPNTSLQLPSALPVVGYTGTNAFGSLTFTAPLAIVTAPGETNRLFVVEQGGFIAVITNLASPNRTVFLDATGLIQGGVPGDERGLLGLVFHPGYSSNGCFFTYYTGNATTAVPEGTNQLHDILSRWQVSPGDPNRADTNSEVRLLTQRDYAGNHNAGDLHFGPDGYLYLSLGDEGGGDDNFNNSQKIDQDFFSGIVRLDVDKRPGSLAPNVHPAVTTNYLVPPDNPFVGATNFNGLPVDPARVRTEFWAVGLRNPWRFNFDPATGFLYCADVGQNAYEEINIIVKGGNYGWAYREGLHLGPKTAPTNFVSIPPIQEYTHGNATNQGYVVIGGLVYHGADARLAGNYVFADYQSGNIWQLHYDGTNTIPFQYLGNEGGIAGFGADPRNGDLLMANQYRNTIRRLVAVTNTSGGTIPATLADTGAFTNLTTLAPAPGFVGYDLNLPFWSDNAMKQRWFSVPNTNLTIGFNANGNWSFPTGAVWMKHFELQLTNGAPASSRRLETRFIVKNTDGVYGLTYRWGGSTTNAALVPEEGMDEDFVVNDGGGVLRTQTWHYPSRAECLRCHTPGGGYALGFNTAQLNCNFNYGGGATNQINALAQAGYFSASVGSIHTLPALAQPTNAAVSREYRVRSYLAANCAFCHQPGGTAQGFWDGRLNTTTEAAGIVNGTLADNLGNTSARVTVPGSISNSMLLARLSTPGAIRMPPLDSTVLDTQAIALVRAWITNDLPHFQSFADWQIARFGSTNAPNGAAYSDPDGDGAINLLEYLTSTDPQNTNSSWRIALQKAGANYQIAFPLLSNRGFEVQVATNLADAQPWSGLDVSGNEPLFGVTNGTKVVTDTSPPGRVKFYRVRVFAP